jgi:hypothetical protein
VDYFIFSLGEELTDVTNSSDLKTLFFLLQLPTNHATYFLSFSTRITNFVNFNI